jgi:hypothetical protein
MRRHSRKVAYAAAVVFSVTLSLAAGPPGHDDVLIASPRLAVAATPEEAPTAESAVTGLRAVDASSPRQPCPRSRAAGPCAAVIGSTVTYRDGGHITTVYSHCRELPSSTR